MRAASAQLIALLASQQFLMADLLTITTAAGTAYRYTSADIDLRYSGNTFSSTDLKFKRGRTRTVIGVEVDTLDLVLYAAPTNLIGGVAVLQSLHNGGLDGATVRLERVFMPTWGDTSAGTVLLFQGTMSESQFGRTEANLTVKSALELLNVKMPRNLYSPQCIHTLYDTGCGLTKASFAITGTISAGATTRVLPCNLTQASGWFDQGTLVLTSGANNGVKRNIQTYTGGQATLSYPLSVAPSAGDNFTAYPGCDKTQATCQSTKFNNLIGFRGFPYIPTPEAAL
jgi:uncharacterized phage protein (TIGR02218 family)